MEKSIEKHQEEVVNILSNQQEELLELLSVQSDVTDKRIDKILSEQEKTRNVIQEKLAQLDTKIVHIENKLTSIDMAFTSPDGKVDYAIHKEYHDNKMKFYSFLRNLKGNTVMKVTEWVTISLIAWFSINLFKGLKIFE